MCSIFSSYSTSYATLNVETMWCTTAASIVYIGITVLSCTDFFWNQEPRISRPCCTLLFFLSYSTSYATLNVETTRCTTAASIVYIGITSKVLWWLFASVCEWKHTGCTICIIYIIQKIENFVHGYISAIKYQATFWVGWQFLSQFTQKKKNYTS